MKPTCEAIIERGALVAAVLLASLAGSTPAHADLMLTGTVLRDCSITTADEEKFVACINYIQGILDGFYRVDQSVVETTNEHGGFFGLCLPKNGVRGEVLVEQLRQHVAAVPKDESVPARTVIFGVLKQMYPCRDAPEPKP